MFSRAFEVHPYSWVPIGSLEHLNEAKIEEFRDFYKTYYVPNNATLSIAGDFDKKQLKKWINKYFSTIPRGTKKMHRPTIKEPIKHKEVRDVVSKFDKHSNGRISLAEFSREMRPKSPVRH